MPRPEVFNRAEVVQKVQAVFWDKGYNGTSMQDLVDATGLNRSSIYNSFGSKHELFMLSLKQYQKQNIEGINNMQAVTDSPLQLLRSLFDKAANACSDSENKGCMMVNCATELANQMPDVEAYISGSNNGVQQTFTALLAAAKDKGEIASDTDTDLMGHYLLMSLQGLRVNGLTNKDPKLLAAMVAQIFKNIK